MAVVFERPKALLDVPMHFCPGCGHGIVHRLVCEVLDEMGIEGNTIGVVPVGSPSTIAAAISKGIHPCVHIINVMATVALDD